MLRRIIGFVDWRFLIALCLLVGVGAAVHGALEAGQERDRVLAAAAVERREASTERDRLLQGQRDLAGKYDRLIRWLNNQHIVVPPEVLNGHTIRVDNNDDNDDSDDSDDNDDNGTTPRPTTPARTSSPPPKGNGGGGSDNGDSKSGTASATKSGSPQSGSAEGRSPGRGRSAE